MSNDVKNDRQLEVLASKLKNFLIIEAVYHRIGRIIIQGRTPRGAVVYDRDISRICSESGFDCEIGRTEDGLILSLFPLKVSGVRKTKSRLPWLNIFLFVITFITATFAIPFYNGEGFGIGSLLNGLQYSVPLMAILLFHESGHYIASRRHKVKVSLPFFIPAPTFLGTFGAFIKTKSPFYNRRQLLDVGAAGPLAGFVIAVIAVIIGLSSSQIVKADDAAAGISLGESIILKLLVYLVVGVIPGGYELVLGPIAFAGWVGLFVTMLNLIPSGQLDGGHISYALFGRRQHLVSRLVILGMIPLGLLWPGWYFWAFLLLFLIPKHPPTLNDDYKLDPGRRWIGYVCLVIFILTFTPVPLKIGMN